ncbi:MAG: outer membrane protein assembly factor BamA [Bdellovibrionota bacterium]|jgi:outer membrane protein insertion porin family
MKIRGMLCLLVMFLLAGQVCFADDTLYNIVGVTVEGNRRIDTEAITKNIKKKVGSISSDDIDNNIRVLYKTGFFEQVTASIVTEPRGKVLKYTVIEKPVAHKVFIKGNEGISESELAEVMTFGEKRFVDKTAISALIRKAIAFYQTRGYFDASFEHSVVVVGENQVDVTFTVVEGPRYKVRKVEIRGLETVDEDDLRDKMATKRYKWWNSWLFSTGRLSKDALENDRNIIKQFLFDNGLIDAQVSEAAVEKIEDDAGLIVVFDVVEGAVYKVGRLSVSGDLIDYSAEKTLKGIKSEPGDTFCATALRNDAFKISEKFSDIGYAYVNVVPNTAVDRERNTVNVNFNVNKGKPVKVNKIVIHGNNKTYDNVIRRELKIHEQDIYSGTKIKRSKTLLERLGYFEEVNITTEQTKRDDEVNLDVNVREGSTGAFSVGAGFSSSDGALFNMRLSENNFLGTGRQLSLNVDMGTERDNIVLSAHDRRFNDTYWGLGADLLKTDREFSDFDRQLMGGGVTASYPLEEAFGEWAEDISYSMRYEYLDIEISDINYESAAPLVLRSEGTSSSSSITPKLTRNTINNPINPTKGSRQIAEIELSGLGGSEEFWLAQVHNQWYQPIYRSDEWGDLVFSWRFRFGYGKTYDSDDEFPLFRRFFPGGINSVRGFDDRTLGPKDEDGNEYGGNKQFVNNLEIIFPIVNSAGLKGVIFYDMGQAFDDDESLDLGDLREAYGVGLRWASPLGPIRIEFGFPIDREKGEDSMVTQFSFGAPL